MGARYVEIEIEIEIDGCRVQDRCTRYRVGKTALLCNLVPYDLSNPY